MVILRDMMGALAMIPVPIGFIDELFYRRHFFEERPVCIIHQKAIRCKQRHLRIVRYQRQPLLKVLFKALDSIFSIAPFDVAPPHKLHWGAQRVADRAADQAPTDRRMNISHMNPPLNGWQIIIGYIQ